MCIQSELRKRSFFCTQYNTGLCRSSHQRSCKKTLFLKILQNSQENTCARVSFLLKLQATVRTFMKKETLAQVFCCEFYEIFETNFFTEHLWVTACFNGLKLLALSFIAKYWSIRLNYLRIYCVIYSIYFFLLAIILGTLLSQSFYHMFTLYWAHINPFSTNVPLM